MMKLILLLLAIFSIASFAEEDDVLVLTAENFDETIQQNKHILVEFYAPWCGHCKRLAPEYASAATKLKGVVPVAKIDADNENNRVVANKYDIRGFPTIKFFRDGKDVDYNGDRTADAIVAYVKRQSLPAVSQLADIDAVTKFSEEDRVVIVGFFASDSSDEYKKFQEVAEALRENFIFGAVINQPATNTHFGVESANSVVLFKKFDEGKNVLPAAEFANLESFINKNSVPLIDEVGPQNYKFYADSGLPLGFVFVDLSVAGQKDKYVDMIVPIARETRGKLNWVYIDWVKYSKHAERLGLSGNTVPAVAIEKLTDGTHYAFDEKAEISTATIQEWTNKFVNGELAPTIKSEEVPAENNGPVKVVVAKNFDEIVMDSTKDVLLEFYAPWCGHCKQLAPTYEHVGTTLKDISSVVIAKIDATANDVNPNLNIRGFPTIKLFRANDKANPIDYEGDRTFGDLVKFLEDNASIKFTAPAEKDEL